MFHEESLKEDKSWQLSPREAGNIGCFCRQGDGIYNHICDHMFKYVRNTFVYTQGNYVLPYYTMCCNKILYCIALYCVIGEYSLVWYGMYGMVWYN